MKRLNQREGVKLLSDSEYTRQDLLGKAQLPSVRCRLSVYPIETDSQRARDSLVMLEGIKREEASIVKKNKDGQGSECAAKSQNSLEKQRSMPDIYEMLQIFREHGIEVKFCKLSAISGHVCFIVMCHNITSKVSRERERDSQVIQHFRRVIKPRSIKEKGRSVVRSTGQYNQRSANKLRKGKEKKSQQSYERVRSFVYKQEW